MAIEANLAAPAQSLAEIGWHGWPAGTPPRVGFSLSYMQAQQQGSEDSIASLDPLIANFAAASASLAGKAEG